MSAPDRRPTPADLGKTTGAFVRSAGWRSINLHTHISLVNRYVYFEVPKAGCGTMKATLGGLEAARLSPAQVEKVQERPHDRSLMTPFVKPFQLPADQLEDALTSRKFTRFSVVREPASRLLSGYLEKICQGLQQAQPIFDILVEQGHAPESPSDISFAQFIDVVTTLPSREQDPHWRRQTDQIGYGIVKFDEVIRLNELDASWEKVAKLTRTPDLQDQFFCRNSTGANSKITDFYTPELLAKVVESYADDYKAFGFAAPSLGR